MEVPQCRSSSERERNLQRYMQMMELRRRMGTATENTADDKEGTGFDYQQAMLFSGVGILFVLLIDVIVRMATKSRERGQSAEAITIDGRTYVPI